jgi:hypothetical protein
MSWELISCWIEAHPGLASWVQAIGSIAALGLAVWIPANQRRHEYELNVAHDKQRSLGYATRLHLMIKEFRKTFDLIPDSYSIGTTGADQQASYILERLLDRIDHGFREDLDPERVLLTMHFRAVLTDLLTILRAELGMYGKGHRDSEVARCKALSIPILDRSEALFKAATPH